MELPGIIRKVGKQEREARGTCEALLGDMTHLCTLT